MKELLECVRKIGIRNFKARSINGQTNTLAAFGLVAEAEIALRPIRGQMAFESMCK